jgi:hypothetical protein
MRTLFIILIFLTFPSNTWADYCPFSKGNTWVYQGHMFNNVVEFKQEIIEESKKNNTTSFVMTSTANDVVLLNTLYFNKKNDSLILYKKRSLKGEEISYNPARTEMLCHAQVGDSWSWQSIDNIDYLNYQVIKTENISVPAGNFESIVIKFSGKLEGSEVHDSYYWFANNIGSIKEEINTNKAILIRELTNYNIK